MRSTRSTTGSLVTSPIPRTAGLAANTVSGTIQINEQAALAATVASRSPEATAAAAAAASLARPTTVPTQYGELPGYQTTYGQMMDHKARELESSLETRRPHTAGGDPRFGTMPRVMAPGMHGAYSTYKQDFGDESSDPMTRQPESRFTQTRAATTRDLNEGTTRNTSHPPRYTGHIPASKYNTPEALTQGAAASPRADHKADCLLFQLNNFSRGRLPGTTTYKPQAARNVTTFQPSQGPTDKTTSGEAAMRGTAFGVPKQPHTHHINSRAGLLTFFQNSQTGTEWVSENGLFNAQVFYKLLRPYEGSLKHSKLPGVTDYGAPFNPANSMV